MPKKYDAVVIGAGLGGLSAATLLARSGKSVLLLERHNIPGGYATTFCRGRFEFDISLHELSGIGPPEDRGDLYKYLEMVGVTEKLNFLPMPDLFRVADNDIDMTIPAGRDTSQEYLMDQFPKEAEKIDTFFEVMRDVMNDFRGILGGAANPGADLSPDKFPGYVKYGMKPWGEVLDGMIEDDKLKKVLSAYWGYLGLPPSKLPFHLMTAVWESFLDTPPNHIRGRCQALSNAFIEVITEHGGDVKFNCGAKKILTDGKSISGVITDEDEEISAKVVISNANPHTTLIDLVGMEHAPKKILKDITSRVPGFSTVNLYVGLSCPPETIGAAVHENFINMAGDIENMWEESFTLKPPKGFLLTCYNVTDPEFSPPGTSVVVITSSAYARPWYLLPPERYVEEKNAYAAAILDIAEEYYPGFKEHIEVIEVATPITNMRYTGNPGGAIYGSEQYLSDSGMLRLRHKTPIGGLFFASAWTIPGGGYQPSISSGSIAAGRALAKLS